MKASNFLVRVIATTAVWSIAVVIGMRLRHPMIALTLGAVATGVTVLIWAYRSYSGRE